MGTHPIFESDFDCLTECAMGAWSVFPSSVLNWINEAGPYYYACYLAINISAYIPVGILCAGAIRHPKIGNWTTNFVKNRLQKAQTLKQNSNNSFNNWRYNRMEKRWSKMVQRAENESSQFALGFTLGLLANETILMPPHLVLAAPMTPIFKGLVSHLPWLDDKFHSVGDYCLESLRKDLQKRENRVINGNSVPESSIPENSVPESSISDTNQLEDKT